MRCTALVQRWPAAASGSPSGRCTREGKHTVSPSSVSDHSSPFLLPEPPHTHPPLLPHPPPCSPFLDVNVQKHGTIIAVPGVLLVDLFKTGLRLLSTEAILWDLRTRETLWWKFWFSTRDNEPTMAIRFFEKNLFARQQSSKPKIRTFQRGNWVGLRSMNCGQGRGMASNATSAFPIKEIPECPIPFLKPKAQNELTTKHWKEVLRTYWLESKVILHRVFSPIHGPIHGH